MDEAASPAFRSATPAFSACSALEKPLGEIFAGAPGGAFPSKASAGQAQRRSARPAQAAPALRAPPPIPSEHASTRIKSQTPHPEPAPSPHRTPAPRMTVRQQGVTLRVVYGAIGACSSLKPGPETLVFQCCWRATSRGPGRPPEGGKTPLFHPCGHVGDRLLAFGRKPE